MTIAKAMFGILLILGMLQGIQVIHDLEDSRAKKLAENTTGC